MQSATAVRLSTETQLERRVSPRTTSSVGVLLELGRRAIRGQAIDLSQTGILVAHRAVRASAKPRPIALVLELPEGSARIAVRAVRRSGEQFAYEFLALDEQSQALLTDYLFCRLVEEPPRSGVHFAIPRKRRSRRAKRG